MTQKILHPEPPVIINEADYERLQSMANFFMERNPVASERLLEEIERADIRDLDDMPSNVVTMDSEVTYRDETTGKSQSVYLVWPSEADIEKRRISILTPVGAALIGLAEGASIDWETNSGETRHLTILKVTRR